MHQPVHDIVITIVTRDSNGRMERAGQTSSLREVATEDGMETSEKVIDELRARARRLHRAAQRGEPAALAALRGLRELAASNLDGAALQARVQRKHALAAVARQLGFRSWNHATAVLRATAQVDDFGTLLYPERCYPHFNIWSADYGEAEAIRNAHGGYLLAYRHQFLVVDEGFISTLGLSPSDPDWSRIGRNWVRPADPTARTRLYAQLL